MNKSIEVLTRIYKPYKITKKNSVYIFNTTSGNIVLKPNPKINYQKLYNYLKSRNFNYIPKTLKDTRDDLLVLEYQEDIESSTYQKGEDLIHLLALLHNKTSYYKNIPQSIYDDIYNTLINNINYVNNLYDNYYNSFLKKEYPSPSEFLFLNNYTLFYNAINYSKSIIDTWYNNIKDKNRERIVLIHNNPSLDHLIKNSEEYLISWDNYTFDSPVLDLYKFYQNTWEDVDFKSVLNIYNRDFPLLKEEKQLFNILISIPPTILFDKSEYDNTCEVRKLINYLSLSSNILLEI